MKLSFAISYQSTSFSAVGKGDFEGILSQMQKLGFEGVEVALRDPKLVDPKKLETLLNKCKLQLVALGTGQAYVDERISLTDGDSSIRKQAVERLKAHIDLAEIFGSFVVIGLIRGLLCDNKLNSKLIGDFEAEVMDICSYAEKRNVIVTFEPLNRYECNFFNTADEVIDFIKKIKSQNINILLDTFHMNIEEKNLCETIRKSRDYISHIHIADSNRQYPGMGHIDFSEICRTLKEMNYRGFLSGEMLPFPNIETAMSQYIAWMKEVINE